MKFSTFIVLLLFSVSCYAFTDRDSLSDDGQVALAPLSKQNLINDSRQFNNDPLFAISSSRKPIVVDPFATKLNYNILAGMGGLFLGVGYYIDYYQRNAWWLGSRSKFRFQNDWLYALNIDKFGHLYATHLYAHAFSGGYEAANMQAEQSAWFSGLSALAWELYIEIEDGFHQNYGFSPGDAGGDFLGSTFYIAQYYFPFLKNFQPRFSYIPSDSLRHNKTNKHKIFIDDYIGQKYWISMRMKNILPEKISEYWPAFLNLSVGMGVKDLDGSGGGHREFYLALDLDAEELPLHGRFWQFVKNSLNYLHFPMPGIRITPDTKFFVLCF